MRLFSQLLDYLFPFRCCHCRAWGQPGLCPNCWRRYPARPVPLPPELSDLYVLAAGDYRHGLRSAALQLKARGAPQLAQALAEVLARRLRHCQPRWLAQKPLLVPVPASPSRARLRGHRPVELLAEALGRFLQLPVATDILTLVGDPAPRKLLSKDEREADGSLRFHVRKPGPHRQILLVDDIVTTGHTLGRAAQTLKTAGWQPLGCLALAATPGTSGPLKQLAS